MYGIDEVILEYSRSDYSVHLSDFEYKIDCSLGTNPYGKSPALKISQDAFDTIELYPEDNGELVKGIIKYFDEVAELNTYNIAFGCGSIGTLLTINRMFLKPGKKILGIAPQFSAVIDDFNMYGADYNPVHLKKDNNYKFVLDDFVNELLKISDAYIYIDNPNNPTGQVIPRHDLEIIISEAEKRNSFVVIDEAYGDYMDMEESAVALVEKFDNLAVVRTFSKGLGAAGIRLGYVIANKVFIDTFNTVNIPFSKSTIANYVAAQVINSGWHRENKQKIIEGKRRILGELSTLKVGYTSEEVPISVIYCENEDIDLEKVMEKTGLKVVTCSGYVGLGKNAIRLNLHKDIDLLMDCLKETERFIKTV